MSPCTSRHDGTPFEVFHNHQKITPCQIVDHFVKGYDIGMRHLLHQLDVGVEAVRSGAIIGVLTGQPQMRLTDDSDDIELRIVGIQAEERFAIRGPTETLQHEILIDEEAAVDTLCPQQ